MPDGSSSAEMPSKHSPLSRMTHRDYSYARANTGTIRMANGDVLRTCRWGCLYGPGTWTACMAAFCSWNRVPSRSVALRYLSTHRMTQPSSLETKDFVVKSLTQSSKHRWTSLEYIVINSFICLFSMRPVSSRCSAALRPSIAGKAETNRLQANVRAVKVDLRRLI